jgi:hypothetical protein
MKNWIMLLAITAFSVEAQTTPVPQTNPAAVPSVVTSQPTTTPTPSTNIAILPTTSSSMPSTSTATSLPTTAPTTTPTTAASTGPTTSATGPATSTARRFTRPEPAPRVVSAAKPLPRDFNLLITRSVFVHGRKMTYDAPENVTSQPVAPTFTPTRPEKALLFNGSTRTEGEWVAFIEDTAATRVLKVKVGDPIARGKVAAITLTTLNYDAAGKTTLVMIGQNLDGESTGAPTTSPSFAGTPSTGPSSSGAPPALSSGASDMLERLRQKRLKELGGK